MLPLLEFAGDDKEHSLREAIEHIGDVFKLSNAERKELLPSGRQVIIDNRVGWARTYLKKAELVITPRRGFFKITQRGLDVLKKKPTKIDNKYLRQFPEFLKFRTQDKNLKPSVDAISDDLTPVEVLESSFQNLRDEVKAELLEQIVNVSPDFFEKLVVDLLVRIGYGGNLKDAGSAIGKSGDAGIDGVIKEDLLGLNNVYIQAKKWTNPVGRPTVQNFVGALQGKKARSGVLITTSKFTKGAIKYVETIPTVIVLIDGDQLVDLMIDSGLGVSLKSTYEVKEIDQDYFTE